MPTVLIIDDNPSVCDALQLLLNVHDIEATSAFTPQAGVEQVQANPDIALVIQDMNFTQDTTSGEEGWVLLNQLRDINPDLPIILITAWTHLEMAVELVKSGAADYLAKPWDDEKLIATVQNMLELGELQNRQREERVHTQQQRIQLNDKAELKNIVYQSRAMQELLDMAVKLARTDLPVLITGANGCGKEKIADIVQANSPVKNGPYVKVNVGALPAELIEAELFGAEAGAYTGITKKREGRFEAANGGTLFLDELGNLSADGQAKLLRVLQTGEYERLGSSETRRCNVRVISATNADLPKMIAEGRFREDLYYRLNVMELHIPPLKDRPDDILPLLTRFLRQGVHLDKHTVSALQEYPWPGNVRELENACQRAKVLADGEPIKLEHFGLNIQPVKAEKKSLSVEPGRELIEHVLAENQGIVAQAARQLGMSRQALYRRMEKFGIES